MDAIPHAILNFMFNSLRSTSRHQFQNVKREYCVSDKAGQDVRIPEIGSIVSSRSHLRYPHCISHCIGMTNGSICERVRALKYLNKSLCQSIIGETGALLNSQKIERAFQLLDLILDCQNIIPVLPAPK